MKKYKVLYKGIWKSKEYELSLQKWAELTGIKYCTIYARMYKYGWCFQDAIKYKVVYTKREVLRRRRKK